MPNLQVNLVLSLSEGYARTVCEGIYRYARPHRPWGFAFDDHVYPQRMREMGTQGVIGFLSPDDTKRLRDLGIPGIDVAYDPTASDMVGRVGVDHAAIGVMAADDLLHRGFRNLAFFRLNPTPATDRMRDAFAQCAKERSAQCHFYDPQADYPPLLSRDPTIQASLLPVARWLASLPRPVAVLCVDDRRGLQIVELCRRSGIPVPGDIAVLGVSDDDMYCRRAFPLLSSIALPALQVGQEAARMLDMLMSGRPLAQSQLTLLPTKVITRPSTDALVLEDRLVVEALQFIREHAHEGIGVDALTQRFRVNRRTLERRFRQATGKAPHEEIRRLRVEHVRILLVDTDRILDDIAAACGYSTTARMCLAFKQQHHIPPGAYRRRFRSR
ncbi:MAG: substrate-binding domain-containing protein [Phycisphaeraceae bacterium]